MSFKVLIVDDEPIICRGLADTIPWQDYNVEVIDTAHDGKDAIEKIQQIQTVDIVITDVRMPNVDGLQLARYLHEHYPEVHTIIISGYDEFAYAQQALQVGVKDYLLKPVNIDELVNKIQQLIQEMEVERERVKDIHQTFLKNAIFNQVLDFPVHQSDIVEEYEHIRIFPFISVLQDYSKKTRGLPEQERSNIKLMWKNFIDTTLANNGYESISIFTDENVLLTCLLNYQQEEKDAKPLQVLENKSWNQTYKLMYVWSDASIKLNDLNRKFIQLMNNIRYLPLHENKSIVVSDREQNQTHMYPVELENRIINDIFELNEDNNRRLSKELFSYFESHKFLLDKVVQVCSEIMIKLIHRLQSLRSRNDISIELHYTNTVDIRINNSYLLLKELFEEDLTALCKNLEFQKMDEKDWIIERAKKYIHEFYQSNLMVNEVANVVNISPNYLSTLFKQSTGKKFNSYVNELRVEEAKMLLIETPFKVSEIAEQVGFNEYKYFVEVFKKFVGMTPTNYRNLSLK